MLVVADGMAVTVVIDVWTGMIRVSVLTVVVDRLVVVVVDWGRVEKADVMVVVPKTVVKAVSTTTVTKDSGAVTVMVVSLKMLYAQTYGNWLLLQSKKVNEGM